MCSIYSPNVKWPLLDLRHIPSSLLRIPSNWVWFMSQFSYTSKCEYYMYIRISRLSQFCCLFKHKSYCHLGITKIFIAAHSIWRRLILFWGWDYSLWMTQVSNQNISRDPPTPYCSISYQKITQHQDISFKFDNSNWNGLLLGSGVNKMSLMFENSIWISNIQKEFHVNHLRIYKISC